MPISKIVTNSIDGGLTLSPTAPANTLVTTSAGNVGIGTSSPTFKLDVHSASGNLVRFFENASGSNRRIQFTNSGTVNTIESTTGSGSTNLAFAIDGTERMRIDSAGNLLLGSTANPAFAQFLIKQPASDPYARLARFETVNAGTIEALQFVKLSGGIAQVGSITMTTTATAYITSSDYRLKENIAPMTGALAKVSTLKPCTYTWKEDGSEGQGFIAHELAEVVPDAVTGEKDAVNEDGSIKPQGIDTSFLVATLTAAIQELKAEFDEYKRTHP
jgi:hypothetical protein